MSQLELKNCWILHLRIPFNSFENANTKGQELKDKFGCGYRIFSKNGNFDQCESILEKLDYNEGLVKLN